MPSSISLLYDAREGLHALIVDLEAERLYTFAEDVQQVIDRLDDAIVSLGNS